MSCVFVLLRIKGSSPFTLDKSRKTPGYGVLLIVKECLRHYINNMRRMLPIKLMTQHYHFLSSLSPSYQNKSFV